MMTAWFDMDGTLADDGHRHHHMLNGDWDAYHAASVDDKPIEPVARLLRHLSLGMAVGILTSRPNVYRTTTETWLDKLGMHEPECILMRPEGDWSPSGESKVKCLEEHYGSREEAIKNTACIFDDRESVCAALRAAGFYVFNVHRTIPEFIQGDIKR